MSLFGITGELGCHSEDTKVLTPEGIKNWWEIKVGDKVFGVDRMLRIVPTTVRKIWLYDYNKEMIHFKSRRYDFLVTPNHRMLFRKSWWRGFRYIEAGDIIKKRINGYFPTSFGYDGHELKTFDIRKYIKITKNIKNLTPPLPTNDFLFLTGLYLSEGYFSGSLDSNYYLVLRNFKYVKEIQEFLKSLNIKHSVYEDGKIVIHHQDLAIYFKERCGNGAPNKRIPPEILNLSSKHLFHLIRGMFYGDGSYNQCYYTTSKKLRDTLTIALLKCGFHPRIKISKKKGKESVIDGRKIVSKYNLYEIGVSFNPVGWFTSCPNKSWNNHKNYEIVDYDGKVWSFTTDTGNYFTVRNGLPSLSGNSGKTLTLTYLALKNWLVKGRIIYSNYHLYYVPYFEITTVRQLDIMVEGVFVADEFWVSVDARTSNKSRNRIVADIARRSRKRSLEYIYTSQTLDQIDKRIRKIQDFTGYPILNTDNTMCKVLVFRSGYPKAGKYLHTFYFRTPFIFEVFDTNEEILPFEDDVNSKDKLEVKIVFYPRKPKKGEYVEPITKTFYYVYEELSEYIKKYKKLPDELLNEWKKFDNMAWENMKKMVKKGRALW